ncbi:50S ribosomal protein L35 [Caldinitratiruptor microaerophilus]|uniref:Large ribosomal subunit protein bL35 n=1 Tax=Caldinitratiruptor microaerophilus TaxID=671077 RepID=A0AA35CNI2_9FIRM|nr:50S ribosomal protein L35 [Caldinitratiruptor microaerophilus]BDG60837.1 50S ribosomal protein L35 [Caldinitratiruptor microaerophilus]
MPKMKTHRGAAKRFRLTATGRFKRSKGWRSHLLTHKSSRRKRRLRQSTVVAETMEKKVRRLLPYA